MTLFVVPPSIGGSPVDGSSALDGADYISVRQSLSASAVYGNSGADSLLIGGNATAHL